MEVKHTLSEGEVVNWVYQILYALNFLHHEKVMHRDLKLENVMMDFSDVKREDGELICKITDFGFAKKINMDEPAEIIGTPLYMAPEVIEGKKYDNRVDIWALGVITAELLLGHLPFNG